MRRLSAPVSPMRDGISLPSAPGGLSPKAPGGLSPKAPQPPTKSLSNGPPRRPSISMEPRGRLGIAPLQQPPGIGPNR